VCLPLEASAFDAACAVVSPALTLASLLPGARAAVVVGSGGSTFFEAFSRAPEATDGIPDPLDRYTRVVVEAAAREALEPLGVAHVELFPFVSERVRQGAPAIPFQRVGRAAGLASAGPLALQIHPVYGPWWAYRGLVVVDAELPPATPLDDPCDGCPAPCVAACPADAVQRSGFVYAPCRARRLVAEPCRLSCAARIACVRGPEHRYAEAALAFHMAASMPRSG
jgi:epoxyqueuosine reductase QueG